MLTLFAALVSFLVGAAVALWACHVGRTGTQPIPTMYPRDMWHGLTGSSQPEKNGEKDEDDDEAESKRPQRVRA